MRSDIKVGIAIAIVLVVIGVGWYAFYRSSRQGQPVQTPDGGAQVQDDQGRGSEQFRVEMDRPEGAAPTLQANETPDDSPDRDDSIKARAPVVLEQPEIITAEPATDAVERTGDWVDVPSLLPALKAGGQTASVVLPKTGKFTEARVYVVKKNDTYSSIARKQWGDERLWRHIQKANPSIGPRELRPRMTIKIPPRPIRAANAGLSGAVAGASGTTGTDPATGKRYYVVRKGDNGFWGVSKAVYGTGKYMQKIQAANPGLKARRIRPGQKVWLPNLPVVAAKGVSRAGRSVSAGSGTPSVKAMVGGSGAPKRSVLPDGRVFD